MDYLDWYATATDEHRAEHDRHIDALLERFSVNAERAVLRRVLHKIELARAFYLNDEDEWGDRDSEYEDGKAAGLGQASDILWAELDRIGGNDA